MVKSVFTESMQRNFSLAAKNNKSIVCFIINFYSKKNKNTALSIT